MSLYNAQRGNHRLYDFNEFQKLREQEIREAKRRTHQRIKVRDFRDND